MARKVQHSPFRRAYTLLEMLIVLALLAALTGLSWPAVRGMLANSKLRSAAKQVRVALATARWKAMESGEPRRFRYGPGSNWFEVGPLRPTVDPGDFPARPGHGLTKARLQTTTRDLLPGGIRFAEPPNPGQEASRSSPPEPDDDEEPGSQSIVFQPNGRSSQARIVLEGERGLSIEVVLRGLTGTTKIGPVEQREQTP